MCYRPVRNQKVMGFLETFPNEAIPIKTGVWLIIDRS